MTLVLSLVAAPAPAGAQTPALKEGAAQTLFDEAKVLFERGKFDAACEKFAASQELDPKGGTLLNLALCRERQGRVATAWTTFSEARNLSAREGRSDRVSFAESRLKELEKTLPRLLVSVDDATMRTRDLAIRIDGELLPRAVWNRAIPLDPGQHTLEATAPDHMPLTLRVTVTPRVVSTVTVPALARAASTDSAPLVPAPLAPSPSVTEADAPPRWPGWTLVALGAGSVGVGSFFGVDAFARRSDAEALCESGRCEEGSRINDAGVRSAWIANAAIGVGVVALVAGVYLLVRPTPTPTAR